MNLQDIVYRCLNWLIKTRGYTAFATLAHGDLEHRIFRMNQFNLSTARLHEKTFGPFKNKFYGKELAIIACGPSLNNYQPIPNVINIGVNRAFKDSRIILDYIFFHDAEPWSRDEIKELNNYRRGLCTKFYGILTENLDNNYSPANVSESDAIDAGALRYRTNNANFIKGLEPVFQLDISTQPLAAFKSVIFAALQFALWTNPRRIYLVGCDCTVKGHFYEDNCTRPHVHTELKHAYECLKRFATAFYPDTEIVSVNPVGLKGLFRDMLQNGDIAK